MNINAKYMTKRELIEILENVDDDAIILRENAE